jgi:hypothetical protein
MEKAEANNQISPEMKQTAMLAARNRARAARWDLDVAVFFFAVLIIVIILLFQQIGIEIVAPVAMVGLLLGWLMGWRKGKQFYESLYHEELAKLERELIKEQELEAGTIEEKVQKAMRERWEGWR